MSSPVSAPPPFSPSYQPLGPAYSPHMAAAAAHMQQYLQMVQQQRNIMAVAVARQQLQQCHDQAPPMSHDQMGGAPQLKPNQGWLEVYGTSSCTFIFCYTCMCLHHTVSYVLECLTMP